MTLKFLEDLQGYNKYDNTPIQSWKSQKEKRTPSENSHTLDFYQIDRNYHTRMNSELKNLGDEDENENETSQNSLAV